jgi:putative ABC transport system permease protein
MRGARGDSRSEVYLPYWQFPEPGINVVLKSASRPETLAAPLRDAVRDIDPNLPIARIVPLTTVVAQSIEEPRFFALLVAVFAGLALALAGVGIYGLVAYVVARRTPEIGVRLALGAGRFDVFRLIAGDGLKLTGLGMAVGVIASLVMSLSIKPLLFGVEPLDPLTFGAMIGTLFLASAIACVLPARRAMRVDPMVALRAE